MTTALLRVQLPAGVWITDISAEHPASLFRLLTGIETDRGALEVGEIEGGDPPTAAGALENHPAVGEHEQLHLDEEGGLARYRVEDTSLYRFLREAEIPPQHPIEVRAGAMEIEVTAGREHIAQVDEMLDAAGMDHEIVWLVERRGPRGLLTANQREALLVALKEGYLEVPRTAKLAEVADELGTDPSTASGVLRRGQARVLRWFLTGGQKVGKR